MQCPLYFNVIFVIVIIISEIPKESLAYKLFPDKIQADLLNECKCEDQCSNLLLQDENIVYKVQHFRAEYHSIQQGNERSTKTVRLIRDTLCNDNGKTRKHNFQGNVICM